MSAFLCYGGDDAADGCTGDVGFPLRGSVICNTMVLLLSGMFLAPT